METAKLFVFTKDEEYLMKYWIPYHGNLFGFENLYILDHGSNKKTQRVFNEYRDKGINVVDCSDIPFKHKYKYLNREMRLQQKTAKFLIPIDSDEFIAYDQRKKDSFTCDVETINKYLRNFKVSDNKCKFGQMLAIPTEKSYKDSLSEITKFASFISGTSGKSKSFFPAEYFISTDQGNHSGKVSGTNGRVLTKLVLLHYEIRGLDHAKEKAYRGGEAYGFMNSKKQPPLGRTWWSKLQIFKNGDPDKWYEDRTSRMLQNFTIDCNNFSEFMKTLRE